MTQEWLEAQPIGTLFLIRSGGAESPWTVWEVVDAQGGHCSLRKPRRSAHPSNSGWNPGVDVQARLRAIHEALGDVDGYP